MGTAQTAQGQTGTSIGLDNPRQEFAHGRSHMTGVLYQQKHKTNFEKQGRQIQRSRQQIKKKISYLKIVKRIRIAIQMRNARDQITQLILDGSAELGERRAARTGLGILLLLFPDRGLW